MGRERRRVYRGVGCRAKTYGLCQLNMPFPRLKIEQRRMQWIVAHTLKPGPVLAPVLFHIFTSTQSPIMYGWLVGCVHGWPNGGMGRFDLSYLDVRYENQKTKVPSEVDVKPVLGRKFSPNRGNGALPRDDFCKLNQHARPGTTRDTRPSDRSEFSAPNVRTENASSCNSDAFPPSFDTRARVP